MNLMRSINKVGVRFEPVPSLLQVNRCSHFIKTVYSSSLKKIYMSHGLWRDWSLLEKIRFKIAFHVAKRDLPGQPWPCAPWTRWPRTEWCDAWRFDERFLILPCCTWNIWRNAEFIFVEDGKIDYHFPRRTPFTNWCSSGKFIFFRGASKSVQRSYF